MCRRGAGGEFDEYALRKEGRAAVHSHGHFSMGRAYMLISNIYPSIVWILYTCMYTIKRIVYKDIYSASVWSIGGKYTLSEIGKLLLQW